MDKKLEVFIINKYMDMKKLIENEGEYVAPNGTCFCIFHANSQTKAAHYYENDGGGQLFCFAEYRQYTPYDYYKILHPEINTTELAQLLWDRLPKAEQDNILTNLGKTEEYDTLPYIDALIKFKNGEINFKGLLGAIHLALPISDAIKTVDKIYNLPDIKEFKATDKYLYFMKNYPNHYKLISAYLILNSVPDLPDFVYQHLMAVGDCVLIPNIIDNQVYSITFRSLNSDKRFLKYGEFSSLMYGLGELPLDFKYGTPLIIVEGNIDTDSMKQIYPYTLGALTANLTNNQIQLLSHLTNTVILAFDNDSAGQQGIRTAMKRLDNMKVLKFDHYGKLKDTGDLIELQRKGDPDADYIVNLYKRKIDLLINE